MLPRLRKRKLAAGAIDQHNEGAGKLHQLPDRVRVAGRRRINVPSFILLKSLSQNSRRTSIFLFVLHGMTEVSRLLRETIFCLL